MKNTFGQSVSLTVFGESHGAEIGVVIDGLCPGIEIDRNEIDAALSRRRPSSSIDTARRESDSFRIVSGVFQNRSTGAPLTILISNEMQNSGDYEKTRDLARPSHADYTAYAKYHGFEDYRGGGHFSGRITAPIVAAGAILKHALHHLDIHIGTHILSCGGVHDRSFIHIQNDIDALQNADFPILDSTVQKSMTDAILHARENRDSIGGVVQTAVIGVCPGLGEPWFDSMESVLSHALFSIGGIKGIEFGAGFQGCSLPGSLFNDAFRMENGQVVTRTNHNGGINGGITNGMPILFSCAVKPTPSIAQTQQTVNMKTKENASITITGRHDPAIIRRICPVIDSITALVLCDMLAQRFGTDVFLKGECK